MGPPAKPAALKVLPRLWQGLTGLRGKAQAGEDRMRTWIGKIPWRRKWQPTPVFLSGESHGQKSLAGYSPARVAKSQTRLNRLRAHTLEYELD